MKTKKRLSTNSQLIELRGVCTLIKGILPDAIAIDKQKGTTLQSSLKEIMYSLRDAQYKLRGQKETIRRSAQLRSMKIPEVYDFVNALVDKVPPYPRALPSDLSEQELAFRNSAMRFIATLRQIASKMEVSVEYYTLFMAPREGEAKATIDSIVAAVEDMFEAKSFTPELEDIEAIRDALVQKYVSI